MLIFQKLYLQLTLFFIKNKKLKKRFKHFKQHLYAIQQFGKIKIGVTYSLFDGEELLEASLKSVRPFVKYINVAYQNVSWYGEKTDSDLKTFLEDLKQKGLIDKIILFEPDLNKRADVNEITKRQIGVNDVKKAGCNYLLIMDTDEFYDSTAFETAKKQIILKGYDTTFCMQRIYLSPTRQVVYPTSCAIMFISKLSFGRRLSSKTYQPVLVDGTRCLTKIKKSYCFLPNFFYCHHLSGYRKDYEKKLRNLSNRSKKNENNYEENLFEQRVEIEVPSQFSIPRFK